MKVSIDIPEEFVSDFNTDRFNDFFNRIIADISYDGLCGRYEKETAIMMLNAFKVAKINN